MLQEPHGGVASCPYLIVVDPPPFLMLARCHSPKLTRYLHHLDYQPAFLRRSCLCDTLPFPSRIAFSLLSYITTTPLLSTPYADNTEAIATWNGKISLLTPDDDNDNRFQPFKNHTFIQKSKMDSMPVKEVPVPSVDAVKIPEPETKTQHVEHVNTSTNVNVTHHEHLPKGIAETEEEKRTRWFIGSIDCGTTSSRFLIFDGEGTPIASHQIEFENIYPESG
jgi:hypothetical protein